MKVRKSLEKNSNIAHEDKSHMRIACDHADKAMLLHDIIQKSLNMAAWREIQEPWDALVTDGGKSVSSNIANGYTSLYYNSLVETFAIEDGVVIYSFWRPKKVIQGSCHDEMSDKFKAFVATEPRIWKLMPTDEDEATAAEQPAPMPDKKDTFELQAWETARAFDKYIKDFGKKWLKSWSCDLVYNWVEHELQHAATYFRIWRDTYATETADPDPLQVMQLGTIAAQECQKAITFSKEYCMVPDIRCVTREEFEVFKQVFLEKDKPLCRQFQPLASQCRKNNQWKAGELELVRAAPTEMDIAPLVNSYVDLKGQFTDEVTLDLCKYLAVTWKRNIRNCVWDLLDDQLINVIVTRAQELLAVHDVSQPSEKYKFFFTWAKYLKTAHTTDVAVLNQLKALKAKMDESNKNYTSARSEVRLVELAQLDPEERNEHMWSAEFGDTLKAVKDCGKSAQVIGKLVEDLFKTFSELVSGYDGTDSTDGYLQQSQENLALCVEKLKGAHMGVPGLDVEKLKQIIARNTKVYLAGQEYLRVEVPLRPQFAKLNKALIEWDYLALKMPPRYSRWRQRYRRGLLAVDGVGPGQIHGGTSGDGSLRVRHEDDHQHLWEDVPWPPRRVVVAHADHG